MRKFVEKTYFDLISSGEFSWKKFVLDFEKQENICNIINSKEDFDYKEISQKRNYYF